MIGKKMGVGRSTRSGSGSSPPQGIRIDLSWGPCTSLLVLLVLLSMRVVIIRNVIVWW